MANDLINGDQKINESLTVIRKQNNDNLIDLLGLQKTGKGYRFDFFNRSILFNHQDFIDLSGEEVLPALKTVFCQYFLKGLQYKEESSGRLVTFREFSGAGPLYSRFTENTSKIIKQTFSNRLEALQKKCEALYSMPVGKSSYDLSVRFKALPKVPVIFKFNDADEALPANSTLLFHDNAENYLDLKSLATIGTYLTGILIQ